MEELWGLMPYDKTKPDRTPRKFLKVNERDENKNI